MQIGFLTAAVFFELCAKRIERVRKAIAAGARPGAAQHRAFERRDSAPGMRHTKMQQRMLEQRQQRHRS